MRLNFTEEHHFHVSPHASYPMIPIAMMGRPGTRVDTLALVDSGSDDCLFHARWLKRIGLELTRGRPEDRRGIKEGHPVKCYIHRVWLIIGNQSRIRCDVAFSEEIGDDVRDQLLGRETVFDRYRFGFRARNLKLYVGRES